MIGALGECMIGAHAEEHRAEEFHVRRKSSLRAVHARARAHRKKARARRACRGPLRGVHALMNGF